MKNKLTDNQLDAVSGGDYTDITVESITQQLDKKRCPACKNMMTDVVKDNKFMLKCCTCNFFYTKESGHWQKYEEPRQNVFEQVFC